MALYLVTGGAGFIGSHLCEFLLSHGHEVRVLDNFTFQVHGTRRPNLRYIEGAKIIEGDIRHRQVVETALDGVDRIIHLASAVGIGQSQYEVHHYTDSNASGTAMLWDVILKKDLNPECFVMASTMSLYGEGAYRCENCGIVHPEMRKFSGAPEKWDPLCPICGGPIEPIPTGEESPLRPTSVYALSKMYQEHLSLLMADIYGFKVSALRLFNVLGPRQALGNPYTGVAAIFTTAIREGRKPLIYEDGMQSRDFVSVFDVARAFYLASEKRAGGVFNIGTGERHTILELAEIIAEFFNYTSGFDIPGKFRPGDVRHIYADISKARNVLGYNPEWNFRSTVEAFLEWSQNQEIENKVIGQDDLSTS